MGEGGAACGWGGWGVPPPYPDPRPGGRVDGVRRRARPGRAARTAARGPGPGGTPRTPKGPPRSPGGRARAGRRGGPSGRPPPLGEGAEAGGAGPAVHPHRCRPMHIAPRRAGHGGRGWWWWWWGGGRARRGRDSNVSPHFDGGVRPRAHDSAFLLFSHWFSGFERARRARPSFHPTPTRRSLHGSLRIAYSCTQAVARPAHNGGRRRQGDAQRRAQCLRPRPALPGRRPVRLARGPPARPGGGWRW